ncbi:hypothetical protein Acr_00g0012230 [Actinidia rufa]|uniref:Uncharacterized protein n=1 Tax=Actinidia rufa TaxID=165716 RepID=A0A7J0DBH8_9ERIC|nr:hypothetical protein Acr_00g0012230 [Actinidia rufa]
MGMGMGMGMVGNVQVVALSVTSILLVGILASPAAAAEEREMVKYSSCNGTIAECFGNELEMVMDSDMSRRFLQGVKGLVTPRTLDESKSIGPNCKRRYTVPSCLPHPNPKPHVPPCNEYNRCKRKPNA